MICLALAGMALLGVGWRGGFYSLIFTDMTGMVRFYPVDIFRRVTTFLDLFRNFHTLEHRACILVGTSLKFPALQIGLFHLLVGNDME